MSDAANIQGVTKLAADCELAAKVMAETGTFETGQAILKEAAAALTALSEQNTSFWNANLRLQRERDALTAQVAELTRERDALADGKDGWKASSDEYERLFRNAKAKIEELVADYKAASDQADDLAAKLDDAEAKVKQLEKLLGHVLDLDERIGHRSTVHDIARAAIRKGDTP
jgi:chromosome segregation ATPase